jgi:AhpD family alkylhydroperoxidase
METQSERWTPGRYTVQRLGREILQQAPRIARGFPDLLYSFKPAGKIDPAIRVAVQLRYARLMGCPVCAGLFPRLATKAGLSPEAVKSALEGGADGLTPEQHGAVVWAGELVTSGGVEPAVVPEPARAISQLLREQLATMTRLELVVHAAGLMFLPHGLIERAAGLA